MKNQIFPRIALIAALALAMPAINWGGPSGSPTEETRQPPPTEPEEKPLEDRSRGRGAPSSLGPTIEFVKPLEGVPTATPLELLVTFTPRRAPINVGSLKVTLLKLIPIDITNRVLPYVTQEGLHVPMVRVPSGRFRFRVTLTDVEGNTTIKEAVLVVI